MMGGAFGFTILAIITICNIRVISRDLIIINVAIKFIPTPTGKVNLAFCEMLPVFRMSSLNAFAGELVKNILVTFANRNVKPSHVK